jgi:hypothetical protein
VSRATTATTPATRRYYERILRENLYVTYAIIPAGVPATTASGWEGTSCRSAS